MDLSPPKLRVQHKSVKSISLANNRCYFLLFCFVFFCVATCSLDPALHDVDESQSGTVTIVCDNQVDDEGVSLSKYTIFSSPLMISTG